MPSQKVSLLVGRVESCLPISLLLSKKDYFPYFSATPLTKLPNPLNPFMTLWLLYMMSLPPPPEIEYLGA